MTTGKPITLTIQNFVGTWIVKFLASGTTGEYISVVLSQPVVVFSYGALADYYRSHL